MRTSTCVYWTNIIAVFVPNQGNIVGGRWVNVKLILDQIILATVFGEMNRRSPADDVADEEWH